MYVPQKFLMVSYAKNHCMAESVGRKIKQIPCSDWLPEGARWTYLVFLGFPMLGKKIGFFAIK